MMTGIDKYLEKYLEGTISEQELKEFQALVDQDPRLQLELGETLELRSLMHDDLLELSLPESLSESVRLDVADRFAALADQEEEEERKRPFVVISDRFAGTFAMTMLVMVMIALAPIINGSSGDEEMAYVSGPRENSSTGELAAVTPEATTPAPATLQGQTSRENQTATPVAERRSTRSSRESQQVDLGREQVTTDRNVAVNDPVPTTNPVIPVTEEPMPVMVAVVDQASRPDLKNDFYREPDSDRLPNELSMIIDGAAQVPSLDADVRRMARNIEPSLPQFLSPAEIQGASFPEAERRSELEDEIAMSDIPAAPIVRQNPNQQDEQQYQRVMFGGTLASGMTSKSSNISLQGSAFLALGLSENNRIGLEGGSTMFNSTKTVPIETSVPQFAARQNTNSGAGGIGIAYVNPSDLYLNGLGQNGGGEGSPEGNGAHQNGSNNNGLQNLPYEIDDPWNTNTNSSIPGQQQNRYRGQRVGSGYSYYSYESESSFVYGLLFYDQTITGIGERLKIHGRVGVGGTNGGAILDTRAYASISSDENVAWTFGIGSSLLHEFTQGFRLNANYGLTAGVELGL